MSRRDASENNPLCLRPGCPNRAVGYNGKTPGYCPDHGRRIRERETAKRLRDLETQTARIVEADRKETEREQKKLTDLEIKRDSYLSGRSVRQRLLEAQKVVHHQIHDEKKKRDNEDLEDVTLDCRNLTTSDPSPAPQNPRSSPSLRLRMIPMRPLKVAGFRLPSFTF
jgi:hypothetical protein